MLVDDIEGAKTLFDYRTRAHGFSKYSAIYACTNENASAYFNLFDWNNVDKVLLTTGSGDQALHAAYYGVENIHTFDINSLSKYYLDYKIAAIKAFNYEEYLLFINSICDNSNHEEDYYFNTLKLYLPQDSYEFWEKVFIYNFLMNKRYPADNKSLFFKISYSKFSLKDLKKHLTFLRSENDYNILKNNINNISFTFHNINLIDLPKLDESFDKIFLSNIPDYLENIFKMYFLYNFKNFITEDINKMLSKDGDLMISYLYNINEDGYQYGWNDRPIRDKDKRDEYFKDITSIGRFDSVHYVDEYPYDGVMMMKKLKR